MRRAILVGFVLNAAGAGAGSPLAAGHQPPLLEPDLDAMAAPIRRGLEVQRERIEALAAMPDADPIALAAAYGQLGQLYHAHGLPEAALAAYANARRLDSGAMRWAYYTGVLQQARGELATARATLEASRALVPDDVPTLLHLGEVELLEGRLERAAELFGRVAELDPGSAAAWFGLGRVASERRDPTAAAAAFERVLALQPDASIAHYPLGLAYRDLGDAERARRELALRGETPVQSDDPLLRELNTLARLSALQVVLAQAADPAVGARDLVGFAVGQLADVDDAPAYLEAAIVAATSAVPPSGGEPTVAVAAPRLDPAAQARVWSVIGALRVARGETAPAEDAFGTALAIDPALADAAVRLGNLQGRAGRYLDAVASYGRALASEPEHAEALLGRADALALLDRHAEALDDLERLERIAPDQGRVVLRLATELERNGRSEDALRRFRQAAELAATEREQAAAYAGAGRLLAARGELEAARAELRAAVELEPGGPEHRLGVASVEAGLGLFADAAADYAAAVELQGTSEEARIGEASALLLARRFTAARARLEGGVRRLPASRTLRHLLARVLAACPDRALRDGERALELAAALVAEDGTPPARETLAMALAEAGRWEQAVALQSALLEAASRAEAAGAGESRGDRGLVATRLEDNLERYRARSSCCSSDEAALLLP